MLGLDLSRLRVITGDSDVVPKDNGSYSSRVTFMVGNAAIDAARNLKALLINAAARKLEAKPEEVECLGEFYRAGAQDKGLGFADVVTEALKDSGTITVTGNYSTIPQSHGGNKYRGAAIGGTMGYSYSAQVVEVSVDEATGVVTVDKVWVAHDCGKALNRLTVEGQVQGSVWMGMGQAMSEETAYHNGLMLTANMLDYRVPTIQDSPPIEVGIVESIDPHGPFGAKEAGEGSLAAFLPALDQCDRGRHGPALQRPAGDAGPRFCGAGAARACARAQGRRRGLMDVLPPFDLLRPRSLDELVAARAAYPDSRVLGGGTDLLVNIRRGIVAPPVLIDINGVAELRTLTADAQTLEIGASTTLAELAEHPAIVRHYPVVAQAAGNIAGPTHRNMGTVGGNLALDTRCIFYNQSEWWRDANQHCLKTIGDTCHVAPKSRGVCFATFSGDLAPALLVLDADDRYRRPGWPPHHTARRTLYRLCAPGRAGDRDAAATANIFCRCVRARSSPRCARNNTPGLRSGYEKIRIRRSIEYPVTGVAVALRRSGGDLADLRVAFTGTNPRPVRLAGTAGLCGGPLDDACIGVASTRWCAIRSCP